jgi:hypothetical protein
VWPHPGQFVRGNNYMKKRAVSLDGINGYPYRTLTSIEAAPSTRPCRGS